MPSFASSMPNGRIRRRRVLHVRQPPALLDAVGGFETFHAKVALADSELAYVGSANMTMFSRHSMELGVLIEGRAARVVANVVRADPFRLPERCILRKAAFDGDPQYPLHDRTA
jgi:phosphatidylserine/phosphatidylglycerophosphate/cardiolipin synthase-like enzyme